MLFGGSSQCIITALPCIFYGFQQSFWVCERYLEFCMWSSSVEMIFVSKVYIMFVALREEKGLLLSMQLMIS